MSLPSWYSKRKSMFPFEEQRVKNGNIKEKSFFSYKAINLYGGIEELSKIIKSIPKY